MALPFYRFPLLMNMLALFAVYNILACTVMPVFSRQMTFIKAFTGIPRKRPASRWRRLRGASGLVPRALY